MLDASRQLFHSHYTLATCRIVIFEMVLLYYYKNSLNITRLIKQKRRNKKRVNIKEIERMPIIVKYCIYE